MTPIFNYFGTVLAILFVLGFVFSLCGRFMTRADKMGEKPKDKNYNMKGVEPWRDHTNRS